MISRKCRLCIFTLAFVLNLSVSSAGDKAQLVAGAGPSTKIVALFFELFSKTSLAKGYSFTVPERSIKHVGGIKASSQYLFGRTGRPLNEEEKAMDKDEIQLAMIPIAFATGSEVEVSYLTLDQLQGIYEGRISNWREVGGAAAPIALVGREKTEALFTALHNAYPFFQSVSFNRIFNRDHQLVNYLKSRAGGSALGFGASSNLEGFNVLEIDDFDVGINVGLVYDRSNHEHFIIRAVKDFSTSADWREAVMEAGYLPAH